MDKPSQIGDFTIFGFTQKPGLLFQQHVSDRLGIIPRMLDFGTTGALFIHTTYGELAENEDVLALKLGFLRSPDMSPLSTRQLLDEHIINFDVFDSERMRGNALVAGLGRKDCFVSAFKTLLGIPQLYYALVDGGIICSDRLKCIVRLLDQAEIDENIIPMHFLFRSTPGDLTYYRQIRRLLPGEFLLWKEGKLSLRLTQDFRFNNSPEGVYREGQSVLESLYNNLKYVVGDYVTQVEQRGEGLINLLSGGVDSSLLQHIINEQTSNPPSRSSSFAIQVPSFSFEIEYARQASQLLHTEHTFVNIQADDYPDLITRTIDALAQPPILETEPAMLSVAEHARASRSRGRYFFSGQGADALFGLDRSKKLKGLHLAGQIPGSAWLLKETGKILKPFANISQVLLKGGDILALTKDPDAFISPENSVSVYVNTDTLRRCFGDDVLRNALRYRRELASRYLDTDHYLEKVHFIDLLTDAYEVELQRHQLFLAQEREKLHPFFDDDILHAGFSIPPRSRYIQRLRPKYLLKDILHQKTGVAAAHRPKGFSIWETDLYAWMKCGPLRSMVNDIRIPGFLSRNDYIRMLEKPDYFLWVLLIFDLFQRSLTEQK